ncbi:MAG: hypothetical protein A3F42_01645 [Gammaproteobacteria bacterium RIFCSPHIGHO2_12_FULL_37_34]|nr:MAG: hypothetical protein A3F42_01645 [Gammaproteobacteria bacterium RIFCSPHIGHO2_12_FULL_37_34]
MNLPDRYKFLILLCLILTSLHSVRLFAQQNDEIRFITIADIHFDPFLACYQEKIKPCPLIERLRRLPVWQWSPILKQYDRIPPAYRFNTNYPLFASFLVAAKQIAEQKDAQFVLVLGDFIGHDYQEYYRQYTMDYSKTGYQSFFNKTFEYVTYELTHAFPNVSIFPVIGNNDSYDGNYTFYSNGKFYNDLQNVWITLIKDKTNRVRMASTFPIDGYYAVDIQPDLRLIVLNTVLFSDKAVGRRTNQAAWKELDWFHDQLALAQAKQQKVMIAMHIPPGIDIYASLEFRLFRLLDLWKLNYTKRFEAELRQFAPEILGVFAGHLHTDWFQILTLSHVHRIPITGTPSISPIYGNNPGFKLYTYSPISERFTRFETYTYAIDTHHLWKRESYQDKNLHHRFSKHDFNLALLRIVPYPASTQCDTTWRPSLSLFCFYCVR